MNNVLVSIIIPTYNNQDSLAICLESINHQTYKQIEVIMVDGGSSDLTREIGKTYGAKVIKSDLGMAAARKRGAKLANGEYVFHVDSDMELTPGVVEDCVNNMEDNNAVIIPETNIGDSFWARATDIGKRIARQKETGNLRFLRRDDYLYVGGHNPKLLAKEDRELHILVKQHVDSIGHIDSEIRHHVGNVSLLDVLSRRWRYMKSLKDFEEHARITDDQEREYKTTVANKSTSTILFKEFAKDPVNVFGYLLLKMLTMVLAVGHRMYKK